MGIYDFDKVPERKGTDSLKYDFGKERKNREDLLPLWVADMDFALPDSILKKLEQRVAHGIFGYTDPKEDYYASLNAWFVKHHGWEIQAQWNTVTPGVVYGIATAIRAFTRPGEAVIIQQPVYYPFAEMIELNDRRLVNNQLQFENGKYTIDFEDFEKKIRENDVKLFILCNPHNPVGRIWTKEELRQLGAICEQYDVVIFSDEIHCDFAFADNRYTPFATLGEQFHKRLIVGTSASKTFNIAGLQVANIIIPDEDLRKRYQLVHAASGYSQGNALGLLATKLVYEEGEQWYQEMLQYLEGNLEFVRDFLKKELPQVQLVEPEGTYLIWLDFRKTGLTGQQIDDRIINKAHLWLDSGSIFGQETDCFQRINIACPRSILEQAFLQLKQSLE